MRVIWPGVVAVTLLLGGSVRAEQPAVATQELTTMLQAFAGWIVTPEDWPDEAVALELSEVSLDGKRLRLAGAASSSKVYSALLRGLEDDERFTDVAMGAMTRKPWGVAFEVACDYTPMPDGPARPTVLQEVRMAAWQGEMRLHSSEAFGPEDGSASRVEFAGSSRTRGPLDALGERFKRKLPGSLLELSPGNEGPWGIAFHATLWFHADGRPMAPAQEALAP